MRLAGLIVKLAASGAASVGDHAIDLALLAGADIQGTVGREGQRPDVTLTGSEVFGGAAVLDAVHLAIGRGAGVNRASAVDGDRVDLRLIGSSDHGAIARGVNFQKTAAIAGTEIERAIG